MHEFNKINCLFAMGFQSLHILCRNCSQRHFFLRSQTALGRILFLTSIISVLFICFSARYPPYSEKKLSFISFMMKLPAIKMTYLPHALMFGLGFAASIGINYLLKVTNWFFNLGVHNVSTKLLAYFCSSDVLWSNKKMGYLSSKENKNVGQI